MADLKTKADLQRLVDEGLEESLTLDYKASPALSRDGKKPDEVCKDVTALANSAGGQIVYGIEEDKATQKPSRVDEGVADPKVTREWIEQILNSRVQPRMNGVQTGRIDMGNGRFGYIISVPQSQTGPHQAPDGKYYKRFDLQSVPMHDYEIRDVMRRSTTPDLHVSLSFPGGRKQIIEFTPNSPHSKSFELYASITNLSAQPAYHVIVTIGLASELVVVNRGEYVSLDQADNELGTPMHWFRYVIGSPPALPIFKEHSTSLSDLAPLRLALDPRDLGIHGLFDMTVIVSAPGFSSTEHWAMNYRGSTLTIHPPESEFAAKRPSS
jgi:hypothetical protein